MTKLQDMNPGRYGVELSSGGNILPAMAAYKTLPGLEGATYYYYEIPKNPVNDWLVAEHKKRFNAPPDFFTAGGFASAMAVVAAVTKAKSLDTEKLIAAMEGLEFDTPKGKMVFRKEDHQALQSMYHFKIKADPAVAWGIPELVRELKSREIGVLITDHNVRETLDIVDRACIIYDGQVLFQGTPEALVADQEVRRLYLGESFAL